MKQDFSDRLAFAKAIARAAGEALLAIRDTDLPRREEGDQLKSAADLGAEALLTTLLKQHYPDEAIIAEEAGILNVVKDASPEQSERVMRQTETVWRANRRRSKATEDGSDGISALKKNKPCWIVDPLDGTRSYHEGFDGFCVQLAYVEGGIAQLGVVYQPVTRVMYSAIRGRGAFREQGKKKVRLPPRLTRRTKTYIDSRPAKGAAREILDSLGIKKFFECGSFGIKLCKIAEGSADVFLKNAPFKLWDVAPAEVILNETGKKVTLWNGGAVRYDGTMLGGENLLAAPRSMYARVVKKVHEALG